MTLELPIDYEGEAFVNTLLVTESMHDSSNNPSPPTHCHCCSVDSEISVACSTYRTSFMTAGQNFSRSPTTSSLLSTLAKSASSILLERLSTMASLKAVCPRSHSLYHLPAPARPDYMVLICTATLMIPSSIPALHHPLSSPHIFWSTVSRPLKPKWWPTFFNLTATILSSWWCACLCIYKK